MVTETILCSLGPLGSQMNQHWHSYCRLLCRQQPWTRDSSQQFPGHWFLPSWFSHLISSVLFIYMTVLACVLSCHLINENDDDDDGYGSVFQTSRVQTLLNKYSTCIMVFVNVTIPSVLSNTVVWQKWHSIRKKIVNQQFSKVLLRETFGGTGPTWIDLLKKYPG